jgi:hypothetical protein
VDSKSASTQFFSLAKTSKLNPLLSLCCSSIAPTVPEVSEMSMPSASIAGGSDEVQRNIIGEKTLGLPKDAQADPKTPFKDIPKN